MVNAGQQYWKACWVQALAGSNPASSAHPDQARWNRASSAFRRKFRSSLIPSLIRSRSTLRRGVVSVPEQPADLLGDITADGVDEVLVALGHGGTGPSHERHRRRGRDT